MEDTMNQQSYTAGSIVHKSGTYQLCDRNGIAYTGLNIQLNAGDIFPPADKDGQYYYLCE